MQFAVVVLYRDCAQFTAVLGPGISSYDIPIKTVDNSILVQRNKILVSNTITSRANNSVKIEFSPSGSEDTEVIWFSSGLNWTPSYILRHGQSKNSSQLNATIFSELDFTLSSWAFILKNSFYGAHERSYIRRYEKARAAPSSSAMPESDFDGDNSLLPLSRTINVSDQLKSIEPGSRKIFIADQLQSSPGEFYLINIGNTGRVSARLAIQVKALDDLPMGGLSVHGDDLILETVWLGNTNIPDLRKNESYLVSLSSVPATAVVVYESKDQEKAGKSERKVKETKAIHANVETNAAAKFIFQLPFPSNMIEGSLKPQPDMTTGDGYLWIRQIAEPGQKFNVEYACWQYI
jgi:hypothetical protein